MNLLRSSLLTNTFSLNKQIPLSFFTVQSCNYRKWIKSAALEKNKKLKGSLKNGICEPIVVKTRKGLDRVVLNNEKKDTLFPSRPFESTKSPYWTELPNGIPEDIIKINNLRDNKGARKIRKIVGRGIGSGLGKQCGRGTKGQKSRSGGSTRPGFQGGATPLYKAVRKHGFKNRFRTEYQVVNLNRLQFALDTGQLVQPTDRPINISDLRKAFLKGLKHPVKLLANGKDTFKGPRDTPLNIEVQAVSKTAKEAIENAGGKVTTVYFNKLALQHFLRKPHEEITIKFAQAKQKKAHNYDVPRYVFPEEIKAKQEEHRKARANDPKYKPKFSKYIARMLEHHKE